MAEHAAPEYATAPGNDYASHESTYASFVHLTFVGVLYVASVVVGLAVGAVAGRWLIAFGVFLVATIAAYQGITSGNRTSSYVAIGIALLALALTA